MRTCGECVHFVVVEVDPVEPWHVCGCAVPLWVTEVLNAKEWIDADYVLKSKPCGNCCKFERKTGT